MTTPESLCVMVECARPIAPGQSFYCAFHATTLAVHPDDEPDANQTTPSEPGPFEGYRAPLGIACPACKAPIGEHCRRPSGMFASWEHAARINALMWANAKRADENQHSEGDSRA